LLLVLEAAAVASVAILLLSSKCVYFYDNTSTQQF